jgi:hypothetical protein
MMPGKGSKGNLDPSRSLRSLVGGSARDKHVAGRDDRVVPRDSAGAGNWLVAADRAGLAGGRPGCNSVARDHSGSRERISRGMCCRSKLAAGEPLRRAPPCLFAGGARQWRQLRGNLEPALFGAPNQGSPCRNPAASNDGVPCCFPPSSLNIPSVANADDGTDDSRLRRR